MINQVSVRCFAKNPDWVYLIKPFIDEIHDAGVKTVTSGDNSGTLSDTFGCVEICEKDYEYRTSELVAVFGGDGTMIKAAREFAPFKTPVLCINTGHLGYLSELERGETSFIKSVLAGEYTVDSRSMYNVKIIRGDEEISPTRPILNDAVLANGPVPRIISFDFYCDNALAQSYHSDGLIVATPTGSTAYSMSAGGPVADPTLECIIATPICPHSFYQRPVIFNGNSIFEIKSVKCGENNVYLTLDGDETFRILPDDVIRIERSSETASFVRFKKRTFLNVLSQKMSSER